MPYLITPRTSGSRGLYYESSGSGEALVLINGLGRSIRGFLGFEKLLAETFQVVCPENRGIGRSESVKVSWNLRIEDMAQDVVDVMDDLAIESAHVVGLSLGGMIGMSMGLSNPDRLRSLTVINSSIGGRWTFPRLSTLGAAGLLNGAFHFRDPHEVFGQLLIGRKAGAEHRKVIAAWRRLEKEEGWPKPTVYKQLLAAGRFKPESELAQLKIPTMVLGSTKDRFVPQLNSLRIHRLIPESRYVAMGGGGHELTTDMPHEVAAEVLKFTQSLEPRSEHASTRLSS